MGKKILIVSIMLSAVWALSWSKDVTTRKRLKVDRSKIENRPTEATDTLHGDILGNFLFAGFDKPLRSSYETVFVTNQSGQNIIGIIFECEYMDMSGRQLHKRVVNVKCDIPSGQTRQLRFKSWDHQQAFHYELSPKPRRANGTAFKVKCQCMAIIINKL